MRKKRFSIIFVLVISSIIIPIFPIIFLPTIKSDENHGEIGTLNTSASTEMNTTISIDDRPGSLNDWTWAKDQAYCTGSGTLANPYIISDIFFNTSSYPWNCISIRHSRKHFIVRDCEFKGSSTYAGIQLHNTTNGVVTKNFMYPFTGAFVWVYNSSDNVIQNNNASGGSYYGVLIDPVAGIARNNLVSNNLITHNIDAGIQIRGGASEHNTISNNDIFNNTIGIELFAFANNITITGNLIENSSSIGVLINTLSQNNEIYENCFFTNNIQSVDNALNNSWDNGVRGNYWDNYAGLDSNNNGIGDVPYNITGTGGSQDNFPLMSCPIPSSPSTGIPGYDVILVLFAGVFSIIGIIVISNKRKSKTRME